MSRSAGTTLTSFLSRLVIAAAFIPAGFGKLSNVEFEGHQADVLTDLGIGEPADASVMADPLIIRTTFEPQAVGPDTDGMDEPTASSGDGSDAVPVRARRLHQITVMLVDSPWPNTWRPDLMAWGAALTELVGGCLLLVGLFSRLWGLGLAVAMGFAFYLTSLGQIRTQGWGDLLNDHVFFHQMFAQLALLVLAFSIFVLGAGGLSLDRFFFGRTRPRMIDDDDDED